LRRGLHDDGSHWNRRRRLGRLPPCPAVAGVGAHLWPRCPAGRRCVY
jgi:hypothetical protein